MNLLSKTFCQGVHSSSEPCRDLVNSLEHGANQFMPRKARIPVITLLLTDTLDLEWTTFERQLIFGYCEMDHLQRAGRITTNGLCPMWVSMISRCSSCLYQWRFRTGLSPQDG